MASSRPMKIRDGPTVVDGLSLHYYSFERDMRTIKDYSGTRAQQIVVSYLEGQGRLNSDVTNIEIVEAFSNLAWATRSEVLVARAVNFAGNCEDHPSVVGKIGGIAYRLSCDKLLNQTAETLLSAVFAVLEKAALIGPAFGGTPSSLAEEITLRFKNSGYRIEALADAVAYYDRFFAGMYERK